MDVLRIEPVSISQLKKLRNISRETFRETFSEQNTESNLSAYIESAFTHNKLAEELAHQESTFWFASLNNQLAGYLKINAGSAQTEHQNEPSIEIERIYVLQRFQGKGVGRLLLQHAIHEATRKNVIQIWLGVWEHNIKAIEFYTSFGFTAFGTHQFVLGNDCQTDILMRKMLCGFFPKTLY